MLGLWSKFAFFYTRNWEIFKIIMIKTKIFIHMHKLRSVSTYIKKDLCFYLDQTIHICRIKWCVQCLLFIKNKTFLSDFKQCTRQKTQDITIVPQKVQYCSFKVQLCTLEGLCVYCSPIGINLYLRLNLHNSQHP